MDRVLALFLKAIDFFLSPRNIVSAEACMRARTAIFTFLFWGLLNGVVIFYALFLSGLEIFTSSFFLVANVSCAYLIKKSFSPEKVLLSFSLLLSFIQVVNVLFLKNWIPLASLTFINVIYLNGLIITDARKCLTLLGAVLLATFSAAAILVARENNALWNYSVSAPTPFIYLVLSLFNYFVTLSMVSKIKAMAQKDLYLEVLWQERARRLNDASAMTDAMRRVLAGPVEAIKNRLEQLKNDPDQPTMDALQIQLDELLLISKVMGLIHRSSSGEESLSMPSAHQELIEELTVKIKEAPQL